MRMVNGGNTVKRLEFVVSWRSMTALYILVMGGFKDICAGIADIVFRMGRLGSPVNLPFSARF